MTNAKAVTAVAAVAVDVMAIATVGAARAVARVAKVAVKVVKRAPMERALKDVRAAMAAEKVVAAVDVVATKAVSARVARSASVLTPKENRKTWMLACKPEPLKARNNAQNAARVVIAMSRAQTATSAVSVDHARDVAASGVKTPSATQNPARKAVTSNARKTRASRRKMPTASPAKRVKAGATGVDVVAADVAMTVARAPMKPVMHRLAKASRHNWALHLLKAPKAMSNRLTTISTAITPTMAKAVKSAHVIVMVASVGLARTAVIAQIALVNPMRQQLRQCHKAKPHPKLSPLLLCKRL